MVVVPFARKHHPNMELLDQCLYVKAKAKDIGWSTKLSPTTATNHVDSSLIATLEVQLLFIHGGFIKQE